MPTPSCRLVAATAVSALLALVNPTVASAQVRGSITAGPLTITLTDLDPLDGISPSLEFKPLYVSPSGIPGIYNASLWLYHNDDGTIEYRRQYIGGTETLNYSFEADDDLAATGTLSGREQPGTHRIDIDVSAKTDGTAVENTGVSLSTGQLEFVLSPNTGVEFKLLVGVEAEVADSPELNQFFDSNATLYLFIGEEFPYEPYSYSDRATGSYTIYPLYLAGAHRLDVSETLSASYQNNSENYAKGYTAFHVYGNAFAAPIAVVPEPGTLPMLVAGLAVAGLWRRRRVKPAD